MTKIITIFSAFLILSLVFAKNADAQIQLNGSVDLEFSGGGEDSRFITNGIPRKFRDLNLAVTQLNSFIFAPISDNFFFESRVQLDTWGSGKLNKPRISLASITWDNPDKSYIIKAGRFVSPFGFYSKRQLSTDRNFVQLPLAYSYFTNISDIRGFWPQAGNNTNEEYEEGDVGLPTIYFAGYVTGIGTTWEIKPQKLILDAAITNGTPITIRDRSSLPNIALTSRLFYRPSIFWEQGISVSFGNFMQGDALNEPVRVDETFQKYYQLLLGADTKLAFTYFEIIGEVIYSNWHTTGFVSNSFDQDGSGNLESFYLSNISGNIDIKYEPPSLTGSFLAFRAEHLESLESEDPQGNTLLWDENITRLSAVFGYKLSPNLLLKASFSEQGDFDGSEYAFRIQLSSFF